MVNKAKIEVPEGMLKAAKYASVIPVREKEWFPFSDEFLCGILLAALRWLSDNPIVPTVEQATMLYRDWSQLCNADIPHLARWAATEWQRRMLLSPEPEFMECDTCRAKPGSPPLCQGCLNNRALINKLKNEKTFVEMK